MIYFLRQLIPGVVYRVQIVEELTTNHEGHEVILHLITRENQQIRVWGKQEMLKDVHNELKVDCTLFLAMNQNKCHVVILKTSSDIETKKKSTYIELR